MRPHQITVAGWLAGGFALVVAAVMAASAPLAGAPQAPTLAQESITGRDSYQFYCASCHGATGQGDGPTAAVLKTRPTDLTLLTRRSGGTFPRETVIGVVMGTGRSVPAHGSTEMPLWGPIFRAFDTSEARIRQRIENIVGYVEGLQEQATSRELGEQLFRTHCATCHGSTARGNGPLADQLRQTPPDLTKYTQRNGGVFPSERVRQIIDGRGVPSHGDREMPVWGNAFRTSRDGLTAAGASARIDAIVNYLRSIQERGAE